MRRSDLTAMLVVLLGAGLVLLARPAPAGTAPPVNARRVPVEHTTLVCPAPGVAGPRTGLAAVTSVPLPDPPALAGSPARIGTGRGPAAELDHRGATWSDASAPVQDEVQVSADGGLAAGLAAAVAGVLDDETRGLAAASCAPPGSHWWFVGAGSTPQRSGVLQLANPTSGVAVVDLVFYGPHGPVEPAGGQGLAIAPGARRSVPLTNLVPGLGDVAVEVTARQGQVAAALSESRRDVLDPAGADLLPPAAQPRRTAVLTGIPGAAAARTLSVVNAGAAPAVVRVQVLGPEGAFTPSDLESLRVPAHAVAQTAVPAGLLDGAAAGLRLSADQPVTASVRSSSGTPLADHSYAAAAQPVDTLAGTPLLPGLDGALVLSGAGDTAAIVDVLTYSADGAQLGHRTLDVRGGQTRTVAVGPAGGSVAVRVGGAGPVVAAMLWSRPDNDGTLTSGYPLTPARLTVAEPPVRYQPVPR
jgi:hypothetical protein